MTITKGRIERAGSIRFHDASLHVWEEGLRSTGSRAGWDAQQDWERQFKHDVFKRIVAKLRQLGFTVGPNTHIFTGNNNRFASKGALKADLKLGGRHIELDFFQNVNAPTRPDHGGRYEFNQEELMPYLMRLEMERARRSIREYLLNVFTGYVFEPPKKERRGPNGVTAIEWVQQSYAESCHFKGDLTKYTISDYNNRSGDGGRIEHGARVWFADHHGRIVTGIAHYNINNMWWVITGKYDVRNEASFHLYTKCPENVSLKRNADRRRRKLEKLLAKAVETMNFERAAVLRDIAFPGNPQLFNVWHDEHKLYHCAGFCGYTSQQAKAGKFTAEEVRGWSAAPNKVIAISSMALAA
jgi:hypothetical protein